MALEGRLELTWDYEAEPFWVDGVNTPASEVLKDKRLIRAIETWYKIFSSAEETLHSSDTGGRLNPKKCREALIKMRDVLIPRGEELAKKSGARLVVDFGHDPDLNKLKNSVFTQASHRKNRQPGF